MNSRGVSDLATIDHPPVEVFVWDPATFELGVDQVEAAPGEPVRVYSPARTVVDLDFSPL
jgi:hypothetical protein